MSETVIRKTSFVYPDFAAGRNPDAASCPGAGRITGCGPNRGWNGTLLRTGGGTFGFVEVTN